ncbi:unnamed protein product [Closterium sp. Yama58-4]|nr:unnamed protein product [Closterium sp. Yama58-4]
MTEVLSSHGHASASSASLGLATHPWELMDGGALNKAGAMAAIAESEVFESGDDDEESRLLWQIMMIEEAAREAAAQRAEAVNTTEAAHTAEATRETNETIETTEPTGTSEPTEESTETQLAETSDLTETPDTAEAAEESAEELKQVAEVAAAETTAEECAKEESAEKSAATERAAAESSAAERAVAEDGEAESAVAERAVAESAVAERAVAESAVADSVEAEGAAAESVALVTSTNAAIASDTGTTAIAAAPRAETAETLNAPSSSSNGGGFGGGGIRKSTSASGLFTLESATSNTPTSDTPPISTSAGAAPHKDASRAASTGGSISKSTSTGALSSLISARSFRIRGKSSGGGLSFLPALTVPDSPSASDDHGPLSCSAIPSAAAAAPSRSVGPLLTPSRRFSKWFSFRAADKAQASSGDSNAAAAKSAAQFLSGKPATGGFSSAAVSDSSEVVSLSVAEPIAECESEEGRGSAEETGKSKDTSSLGLVSPKKRMVPFRKMATFNSRYLSLLGLLCIVLCFASAHAQAPAKPTKAQIKAELQNMANAITKKFPQYSKYAKDINKYIGLALNSKYDFTALSDATLLLPSDTEAEALAKKVPVNKANIPRIYNITAYHIIRKKYTVPALKVLKKSQPLGTQLKQAMYKVSQQNGNVVSFAKTPNAPPAAWTTIKIVRLYAGPYFIAHGVDKVLIPTNTKV